MRPDEAGCNRATHSSPFTTMRGGMRSGSSCAHLLVAWSHAKVFLPFSWSECVDFQISQLLLDEIDCRLSLLIERVKLGLIN